MYDVPNITYEVGNDEPLHPDSNVAARMREDGIWMGCGFGCKIYADPNSSVRVLAHHKVYGCNITKETLS